MLTKLTAARLAARSGTSTVIANGRETEVLMRILQGEELGTLLIPEQESVAARKQWLAGQLKVRGTLVLDAGAVEVLRNSGRSLLAVGITGCEGRFSESAAVFRLRPCHFILTVDKSEAGTLVSGFMSPSSAVMDLSRLGPQALDRRLVVACGFLIMQDFLRASKA